MTPGADMTATMEQIREYAEATTALRDYEERTGRACNRDKDEWAALLTRRDAASNAIADRDHFEADRLVFKAFLAVSV